MEMFSDLFLSDEDLYIRCVRMIEDKVEKVRFTRSAQLFKAYYREAIKFQDDPKKCATESDLCREKGNQRYAERKFIPALEYFNRSICFAPERSEQLAKAYANRSAVYFSLRMFELSLKNLKMAREAGYPENLASKLDEREAKCLNELKKLKTKPKNELSGLKPELSYPPHEKVPFIANCLELKVNKKYGRHIVTKSDLKVGDVFAVEQPFCMAISPEVRYMYCANCFRENDMDLIPCPNCHSAMFCSSECLSAANETFHVIECPIMDVLVRSDEFAVRSCITLRLFIFAMKCFKSVEELMEFVKDLNYGEQNVFGVNNEQTKNIDLLASTLKLLRFPPRAVFFTQRNNEFFISMIVETVLNLTDFKESFKSDKEVDFLMNFIICLYEIAVFNTIAGSHKIKTKPETEIRLDQETDRPCYGIYQFLCLLNHSCAPNIKIAKHGVKNVMVVVKPIRGGEQLLNCCGFLHSAIDKNTRKTEIYKRFEFTCHCVACKKNYPVLSPSELHKTYGFIDPQKLIRLCNDYKFDDAKTLIPKYCNFLTVNSDKYPFGNTALAEGLLNELFQLVYTDVIPLADKIRLIDECYK